MLKRVAALCCAIVLVAMAPQAGHAKKQRIWSCTQSKGSTLLATCRIHLGGRPGAVVLRLYGLRKGGWLDVRRATLHHSGGTRRQAFRFGSTDDEVRPGADWVANDRRYVWVADMNFDGQLDFRIGARQAAGPNWGWVHFIWDRAARGFVRNLKLDRAATSMAEFDAGRKLVTNWTRSRSCAGHAGSSKCSCMGHTEAYAWRGRTLERRWLRQNETCGKVCTTVTHRYRAGKIWKTERKPCDN